MQLMSRQTIAAMPDEHSELALNGNSIASRAHGSDRAAMGLSVQEIRALGFYALMIETALDGLIAHAENAEACTCPISGGDVLKILAGHGLYSQENYDQIMKEASHGEEESGN